MLDLFLEIYQTLRLNKLRTALTGFSVAWGIFILIVLLGAANALFSATKSNLDASSSSVSTVYADRTTMPYAGFKAGRPIAFDTTDMAAIRDNMPDRVEGVTSWHTRTDTVRYNGDFAVLSVQGVFPSFYESRQDMRITEGRNINDIDIRDQRKVCVISGAAATNVLKRDSLCVGEKVKIGSSTYTIVGVIKRIFDESRQLVAVPFSTYINVYSQEGHKLYGMEVTTQNVTTKELSEKFNDDLRQFLASRKLFNPADRAAMWIDDSISRRETGSNVIFWINMSVWVIGILTLLSGIVGVSNIMFVSVKERTHEIGVRRALGAKPRNIHTMIMAESVCIMLIFGYLGLVAGVAVTEIASNVVAEMGKGTQAEMFSNIHVGIDIALQTTAAMVLAGMVAGLFPARKATKVNPVEALNYE